MTAPYLLTALYSSDSLYANYMSGGIVDYLKLLKCPIEDNKAHNYLQSVLAISIF